MTTRIEWVGGQCRLLAKIAAEFDETRPFEGLAYRPSLAKLLARWFGYEVETDPPAVHAPDGEAIRLHELHDRIQADPAKRAELYQAAMSLWR